MPLLMIQKLMDECADIIADHMVVNKIYEIRGQNVMRDSDLADLYEVETGRLNEQVKRNMSRFPEDFMFQLSNEEFKSLISQFAISNKRRGGRRKLPYVFTEHGVLMLSSVLNSHKAIQINIQIVRIFIRLKKLLSENTAIKLEIADIKEHLHNHDKNIEQIFNYFHQHNEQKLKSRIRIGFMPDELI
jgi:phage regulator Rha-like protein